MGFGLLEPFLTDCSYNVTRHCVVWWLQAQRLHESGLLRQGDMVRLNALQRAQEVSGLWLFTVDIWVIIVDQEKLLQIDRSKYILWIDICLVSFQEIIGLSKQTRVKTELNQVN